MPYSSPAIATTTPILEVTDLTTSFVEPASIDFGIELACATADRTLQLKNIGGSFLNLQDIELELSLYFEIVTPPAVLVLGEGESTTMVIRGSTPCEGSGSVS
jgi:hypothetical protein